MAEKEALDMPAGWTVLVFSHALAKSRFETGVDPWNYMNYSSEPAMMLLRQAEKRGILLGGWFAGQYACDYETTFCHIPYFLIDSVRPQPVKSAFPDVRKCMERKLGTETEDLWDVLLLKPNQRRIHLLRLAREKTACSTIDGTERRKRWNIPSRPLARCSTARATPS